MEAVHRIGIGEEDGHITGWFDGEIVGSFDDSEWSANTRCGFRLAASYGRVDNFDCDDVETAATLTVTPNPVEEIGVDPTLTLTGTETAWDPNTNTPTFTVDVGSVISQEVTSPTSATMEYALPHVTDTLTVTDPSTGATAQVALDSTLGLDMEVDLTPVLDILGTPAVGHTVTGDQTTTLANLTMPETPPSVTDIVDWFVAGFLAATVPEALLDKLNELYGILPTDQQILSMETLAQVELSWLNRNLGLLTDDVASIAGEEELSLRAVINAICGVPNITVSEVKDLIDALTADGYWDLAGIKAQIDLVRGTPATDLATIYTAIQNIPPLEVSEITDYLDWITNFKAVDLPSLDALLDHLMTDVDEIHTVEVDNYNALTSTGTIFLSTLKTALDALPGADDRDLTEVYDRVSALYSWVQTYLEAMASVQTSQTQIMQDIQSDVHDVHGHVSGLTNTDLTHVNEELDAIKAAIAALATPAPIWPGQANVTLGTAVPLSADLRITGTIDGVIVQLESVPHKLSNFPMGDSTYSYRLGFITFEADAGWLEPWQYLGFDSALYCPRQMKHAAAVRIRYLGDAEGTAQPWSTA